MTTSSPGASFRAALGAEQPLQVPGAVCGYHAILAEKSGFKAAYLSRGIAAGSLGVPDLGISTLDDVLTDCAGSPMPAPCRCSSTSTPDSARARSMSPAP